MSVVVKRDGGDRCGVSLVKKGGGGGPNMAEWHDKAAHGYRTRDSPLENNLRRGTCHLGYINQCNHVHTSVEGGVRGNNVKKKSNNTAAATVWQVYNNIKYDFAIFAKYALATDAAVKSFPRRLISSLLRFTR